MATEKEMYELLGRAMVDDEFRACLIEAPARAAEQLGIQLSEEQLAGLRESDLRRLVADERLAKRP